MKHLEPKVIEVPNSGQKGWVYGYYTLAFVYAKEGNFLVKGHMGEVNDYIKNNFSRYFVRFVMYRHGESRTLLAFSPKCHLSVREPSRKGRTSSYRSRYEVAPYGYYENANMIKLTFKRFPTRWIPEFDYLINNYGK